MTILIEEEETCPFSFDYRQTAKDVIGQSLSEESFPYEAEVSLTLTTDERIHDLNKEFRGIDRATDVLSFPMISYESAGDFSYLEYMEDIFHPETGEAMLGDIVISIDHVIKQAEEYGHSTKREYAFLIAHSMLHLLGYDHMTPQEAAVMEKKQEKILNTLQITREEEKNEKMDEQ